MKNSQIRSLAILLFGLFAASQSADGQTNVLSDSKTRSEIMKSISNDSAMSGEMMGVMMKSKNGTMMMQHQQMRMMENKGSMMNMMKANPGMMHGMFSAMMETAGADSSMMRGMVDIMKSNPYMVQMMQNKKSNGMMNGKHPMHGMKH